MKKRYKAGDKFNEWTLIEYTSKGKWLCQCSCGKIKEVYTCHMAKGNSTKCKECYGASKATIKSIYPKEYNSWTGMKQRCTNPNDDRHKDYLGRGITMCERWEKFENFFEDMGERPEGTSIDRIDNNKGYYKENCRWATTEEQSVNKRNVKHTSIQINNILKENNISKNTFQSRIQRGWSVEDASTLPSCKGRRTDLISKCQ